ncbi:DUF3017 domain-containing protein [Brachybacterium sp. UMB0905]|uniref:DUF3017 domain-containing protein n=1 Tax=Brachybacterium sp. UMB0905 TaxID=2069310 RepID=UPI000C80BA2A|nr:DUF3017 domain-containing protein [Brachybacterium sp. UMB0905]PMC76276.1 DUF3017 domain-containing protein [Brachybacterium sp. UMB0905]
MRRTRSPFTLRAAFQRQAVLIVALLVLGVIVLIGALHSAPLAGMLLSLELGVLALLRAVLPVRTVGALAVRSRALDVTALAVLAIAIGVLSTSPNL